MTSSIAMAVLGLVLAFASSYAQNQGNKHESVIKQLELELETALSKGDAVTLDRIIADDYIEIDTRGGVKKKADVILAARAMKAASRGESVGPEKTVDELTMRLHGDLALVVGRTNIRYQFMEYQTSSTQNPPDSPVAIDQERFIRAYAKVGGKWQLIAWQTTAIARK